MKLLILFSEGALKFNIFKTNILKLNRPTPNSVFDCENHRGVKLIAKPRVGLSHLREHKFKHNFQDTSEKVWN